MCPQEAPVYFLDKQASGDLPASPGAKGDPPADRQNPGQRGGRRQGQRLSFLPLSSWNRRAGRRQALPVLKAGPGPPLTGLVGDFLKASFLA